MKVKNQKNVSRIVKASGMALLLFSAVGQPGMTAYAAGPGETVQAQVEQSPRWEGQGDAWRVKTEDGKGYLTNAWFQDLDGSWYMLGADGYMYSGIVTDPSTGASYLLNTEHDGHFGRMVTANGAYIINGQQVYLTFNNTNPADGTYGAITGGLTELRAAGVKEVTKGAEGTAPQAAAQERNGGHSASVLPMARSASSAASSGASQQVTLSQTRLMPASAQSFSQERIHSPSPQP